MTASPAWYKFLLVAMLLLSACGARPSAPLQPAVSPSPLPPNTPTSPLPTPTHALAIVRVTVPITANVRSGPTVFYPTLGQVGSGSSVEVTGQIESGEWLQIRFPRSPDGRAWIYAPLTSFDRQIQKVAVIGVLPPTPSGAQQAPVSGAFSSLAVDIDSHYFVVAGRGGVLVYNLASLVQERSLETGALQASEAAWSANGNWLAVGLSTPDGQSQQVHIWEARTWQKVVQLSFQDYGSVRRLRWSPDGQHLAVGCENGLLVWEVNSRRMVDQQGNFAGAIEGLAWSPEGDRLAAAPDLAYGIRLWRLGEAGEVRLFDQKAGRTGALDWSLDGSRIASLHRNALLVLWDQESKKPVQFIPVQPDLVDLACSPNGDSLATAGAVVSIWDPETAGQVVEMQPKDGTPALRLAWVEAGHKLLALYVDNAVRLWSAPKGALVREIPLPVP